MQSHPLDIAQGEGEALGVTLADGLADGLAAYAYTCPRTTNGKHAHEGQFSFALQRTIWKRGKRMMMILIYSSLLSIRSHEESKAVRGERMRDDDE